MAELLRVDDLVVRYRAMGPMAALLAGIREPFVDAVLEVSFGLEAGQTLGIVGESGSGKSTLARAIMGLVRPAAGHIRFDGMSPAGRSDAALRPWRRHIALMFQDPLASLSPRLTVQSLITEPFRIHGLAAGDLAAEARRLLAMVGLDPSFASRYPHQLSGGQARRVGVARALALSPKLVIADEPTAGLDVSVQGKILNLMNRLQRAQGLTYVVITHNLPVVRHISDHLAIMYMGRFVEEGATATIFARPAHPTRRRCSPRRPCPTRTGAERRRRSGAKCRACCTGRPDASSTAAAPYAKERCRTVRCHFPLA